MSDAFKRARLKMMQAREAATRELLKDIDKRKWAILLRGALLLVFSNIEELQEVELLPTLPIGWIWWQLLPDTGYRLSVQSKKNCQE